MIGQCITYTKTFSGSVLPYWDSVTKLKQAHFQGQIYMDFAHFILLRYKSREMQYYVLCDSETWSRSHNMCNFIGFAAIPIGTAINVSNGPMFKSSHITPYCPQPQVMYIGPHPAIKDQSQKA